jgi:hypothetical protein
MHLETKVILEDGTVADSYFGIKRQFGWNAKLPTFAVCYKAKSNRSADGKDYYDIHYYVSEKSAQSAIAWDAQNANQQHNHWEQGILAKVSYRLVKDKEDK